MNANVDKGCAIIDLVEYTELIEEKVQTEKELETLTGEFKELEQRSRKDVQDLQQFNHNMMNCIAEMVTVYSFGMNDDDIERLEKYHIPHLEILARRNILDAEKKELTEDVDIDKEKDANE